MTTTVLAEPTVPAGAMREVLFSRASADLQSADAARQILHIPTKLSRYVPPTDIAGIDLRRTPPDGEFAILVRQGQATVMMTIHAGVSEQRTSIPVWNAAVLRDMAVYVVLAAGGDLGTVPTCYEAPEWLIRQIELPPSPRERQRLRIAALLAGLTEREADDLLSAQSAGIIHVVVGVTPEAFCVWSVGDSSCSVPAWAAARSKPDSILVSSDASHWRACFAAQRGQADQCVGVALTIPKAIHALVIGADACERFGITADGDAYDTYDRFASRGLIEHAPFHAELLTMQHI